MKPFKVSLNVFESSFASAARYCILATINVAAMAIPKRAKVTPLLAIASICLAMVLDCVATAFSPSATDFNAVNLLPISVWTIMSFSDIAAIVPMVPNIRTEFMAAFIGSDIPLKSCIKVEAANPSIINALPS